jgi:gliding motility-associated-like protein
MKKIYYIIALCLGFILSNEQVFATHAAGGELIYELVPGQTNQYRFTFKFYRDCSGTAEPATFQMCYNNSCGVNNQSITLTKMVGNLPNGQPNGGVVFVGCNPVPTICNGGVLPGYREWWYQGVVTLPTTCNFWKFWVTLCCRNTGINNLVNSGAQNIFVEATFNNTAQLNLNSSPSIVASPIAYYCINTPSYAYYNAYDPNGDSLVYESINVQTNPAGCATNAPTNIFQAPYTALDPFPTGFFINPATGLIAFTTTTLGRWSFTIRVKEYRNGTLIGSIMRDIQFVVSNCNLPNPLYVTANFIPLVCGGATTTVQAFGFGGILPYQYRLNAGAYQVSNQFPALGVGTYTITIRDAQLCTHSTIVNIVAPPAIQVAAAAAPIACNGGTTTIFAIANNGILPYEFKHQFVPYQLSNQFVVGAGPYVITAKDANGCTGNTLIIINQPPPININVATTILPCSGLANILVTASGNFPPFEYKLNLGAYQPTGNFNGLSPGAYTVTVKDANNCTNSSVVNLNQAPGMSVAISNITNIVCNPFCNGSAQATATGGAPAITYAITAPGIINANTGAMNSLCAGTYTVTATDALLCTATTSFTITQPPAFSVNISNINNVTCNALCNGTATASGVGGTPGYTYAINAPGVINANTGAISALCAGNYTVTTTDASGCTATTSFTITQPPVLGLTVSNIVNVACNPACTGTAQATASGGAPGYSFAISAPGVINITGAISGLCAGSYTVTVTDANGCTKTTQFSVTQPPILNLAISNITNVVCNPQCTGTAQATASGGVANYSYAINAPGVINAAGAISSLCAGTYTVTVTDANGCTRTSSFSISQPPLLNVAVTNITNVTCLAPCVGTAQAISGGGVPGYLYSITAPGVINITGAISGLCAGTYTVTATDANLCTATTTFTVSAPPTLNLNISNITNVTCNGLCNGTAQATGVGGTPAYTYAITAPGIINANTGAITGLCAGTYTVTATDANLCTATTTFTITEPNVLSVSVSNITNVTCNPLCNGTAQATGAGGTAAYTYTINAPGVINANTGAITALCAGTYTVTVTDANLCTATTSFTITQPPVLSVSASNITNVSCNGVCDGTAQANGAGGTPAYTYSITAPGVINANTGAISGLCAGSYTVTVTDANLCTATTTFTITQPAVLSVSVSNITNVTCNGLCDGSAQANGAGGTIAYSYAITAPGVINANTGAISSLCAGTYTVTVTDANLCTATTSFTVTQPLVLSVGVSNITNVTCNGLCNGTAQATGVGGTPAYTYAITAPGIINANTGAITGLCAGTYTVTATDANLCTATTAITITEPNVLSVSVSNITNVTCNPLCNGTAQATGAGGTAAYTYTINAPGVINANTGAITALCAGTYTVTVTDANLCTATTSFTVTQPPVLSVSASNITNVSCNGVCDGTAQANGAGGTPAYTYSITAPGVINANTGAISGLCAGSYTVTVTDANLCTATTTFTITQPAVLSVSVSNITNVTCNGLCDGSAQANGAGGTIAYSYAITAPGVINANTGAISSLCAGTYTVTVTDANLCTATTSFTVTQPLVLSVGVSNITNVTCNGLCNGTAQATGVGGTPAYTYAITAPGIINANTGAITGLCAGIYTITVTDANLCTGTTTFTVTEPNLLTVTVSNITNVICNGQCNGTAQATGAGGTAAYTYAINAPGVINANTGAISALCAGSYTVTVTDANLCTATTSFTITEPTAVVTTITASTNPSCTPGCDGTATVSGVGGNGPIVFTISPAAGPQVPVGTFTGLCAGTNYIITGTDANGCTGTTNISLSTPNSPTVTVSNITSVSCFGDCDAIAQATAIGGTPGYTYSITAPGIIDVNTGAISGLCVGNYTVTVTDASSCVGTTNFVVNGPALLTVDINVTTTPTCTPGCDGTATTTTAGGTAGYSYAISGGAAINAVGTASNLCAGTTYTITVTDANSCSATTTVQLTAPNSPSITINTTTPVTCVPGCDGTATTITAGGTPGYTYAISGGAAINAVGTASNLCAGIIYTITVTDASGCTGTTTVQIIAPNQPTVSTSNITNVTCNGLCNGTAQATGVGGTPAYTYAITAPGIINANTGAITGLCAGTYTITVTDANLCTGTTTFTVTEPNLLTVTVSNITNVICNGQCNGTAQATGAGGTAAYTYAINAPGVINANTGAISALCAGSYTVTVTDANLCTATTSFTITEPTAVVTTITASTNPSCTPGCDGTATVSGAGGNGPIVFTISPAAGPQVPVGTFTNLCAGTNYIITGTDANGCTGTTNISLSTPNSPTVTVSNITSVSCFGDCDAIAQATAVGGTPGYTYSITAPGIIDVNTGAISGLCVGNYTVTVTDASSCVGTTNFVVIGPALLTVDINVTTTPTCTPGCDGTATTTTAGGTAGYSYAISGGAAINAVGTASNLCAGTTYTITVTDANSCSATTTVQLTAPNSPTITINTTTPVTCVPGCDGTATTNIVGGTPGYTYAISGGAAINAVGTASNLCAGIIYTITVTDANSCSATTTVQLIAPNSPTITINTTTPVTCVPGCDGTATTITVGGTPGYTYAISGGAAINAVGTASNLCAGIIYTITVTDANACSGTTTIQLTAPNSPSITINTTTAPTCVPGCDGTATTITAGGTPGYTYAISGGVAIDALGNASNLCAGITYTITVTDANSCSATTTVQLTAPNSPTITINTTTPVTCVPGCDGTATTNTAGGTPGYTYAISGGAAIDALGNASNLCAGIVYTITVTDANACTGTTTVQLVAPNAPTITLNTTTAPTCVPGCDGTATTNTVGGTPAYSYAISGGATIDALGNASNLCAGTIYTITVTDANSCSATTTVQLTAPNAPSITINTTTGPSCVPGCDGTATTTTAGGAPAYTYAISGGATIDVIGSAGNLCAGTVYTITVTDANGCTGTTTVQLAAPSSPTVTITNTTNPSCTPGCDGTATVSGAGGNGPIVFTISPAAGPQVPVGTFTGLCAGTNYIITGTDANGCTGTTNISLSTPNSPTVTISNITSVSCFGDCDAIAQATAIGGTPGYTYSITAPGIIDVNTGAISGLCVGNYTVTVTDASSCVGTTNFVVIGPALLTVDINVTTTPTCTPGCDGTATTTTAGGTAGYSYAISGGAAINAVGTASNLCAGTTYTITVTDANSCSATTTVQLTAPNAPTITINTTTPVTCVPGCDGTATTNIVGGTPGYTYAISGGAAINAVGTASNLCAGIIYTITVTDANSCSATTTVQLIAPNSPTITINTTTPVTCVPGCDGTATTITAGGTPGYTYAISGGAAINAVGTASNLCAGIIYTITVTDANACSGTTTIQLTAPNSPSITINTTTAPTCVPGCDGTATTITAGGTPGYTYAISGGAAIDALGNASNLCAGITYTITVTDANSCSATTTVQLTAPNSPTITINTTTPVTCVPGCDGTATTNTSGGTPGYTYAISGGAVINAIGTASNLCAGIVYTITVTDAIGCSGTTIIQLGSPNSPVISINNTTPVTCVPGCDGTATTNTVGGTPGYTYAISGGATIDALGNAGNLCAVTVYTVTVTDAIGCSATTTIQLTAPNAPIITINTTTGPTCVPGCDGTATTSVAGVNPPYAYAITGGALINAGGTASNLCAGIVYTITTTDASGCTGTTTIQLAAPNAPTVTVTAFTNVTVFAGADGTITVAGAGGTPGYTFAISPLIGAQAPAGNFTGLTSPVNFPAQTCYTITLTDAAGCTATTVQCITQPPIPNLVVTGVVTDETCFGKCDGTLTLGTTGGTAPYTYLLAPGNIPSPTGIYSNLCVGTYTVTSTDINNATGTATFTIGGPTQLQWNNAVATNISCFGAANGALNVNASGGTGLITYTINPLGPQPNITGVYTGLTPQCYTVTATDANGCSITTSLCIVEPSQVTFAAVVAQGNSCNGGLAGTITVAASGGNPLPNYTYVLTPGGQNNQTGQFTGLGAGTYTVTVTDGNGCTATTGGIVINEPPAIVYNTVNVHEVYCYGDATGSIAVVASGGTGPITFSITPNATQLPLGFFKDLLAGSYVITATDANGCTLTTQATIIQNPALQITSLTVVEPICAYDTTGVLDIKATGGTAPITFSLNNGIPKLTGLFTGLPVGVYQITLIDDLGCRKDTNLVLSGPTAVGATIVIDDPKCIDSKDGRVTVVGTGGRGGYKYYITPGLNINKTGQFYNMAAGTYTLRVVDTVGCEYMVEFTINPPANPLGNTMTKQDLGCTGKGNEGTATANTFGGQPPYVYQWSTSPVQNSPMASNLYFGWYNVLIADANGCEYRDSVYIEEGPCCDVSFIPNAFSPNGDNNNDEFKVFSTAGIILIQLEVYDRWGQKVWNTSDWKRGWDGKIDGKDAEVSTYQYIFRYTCTRDGKTYIRKGDITLIR